MLCSDILDMVYIGRVINSSNTVCSAESAIKRLKKVLNV